MAEIHDPAAPSSVRGLLALVREDWRYNRRLWAKPGLQALVVHRCQAWLERRPGPWGAPLLRALGRTLARRVRARHGIEIHPSARLGRRVLLEHQGGIVIGPGVTVGDDCFIRQGVKIGAWPLPGPTGEGAPRIGRGVAFGARAVVEGPVRVGDGVRIGPNAVVSHDVDADVAVIAPPSRIVRRAPGAPASHPAAHASHPPPPAGAV